MELPTFKVSELLAVINQTLDYAYPSVAVEGEVASFKISKGKFAFFDLKDADGVVGCFMMAYQLQHPLEDGMHIRIVARPRVTAWGKFSLTVRQVMPVGQGSIKRAFALLRAKLEQEGLFDPARKRPLPKIPTTIGLVASAESAGFADFLKILHARWGDVLVEVADVQVQGIAAAEQIIRAIDHFNQASQLPDVLVIIRGGGSAEDLAVFNDEALVRAVAASRIPTLVGVGHETDTSLCDLAADVRAATPSNAAQLLVPDKQAVMQEITQREFRLYNQIQSRFAQVRQRASRAPQYMVSRLNALLAGQFQRLQYAQRLLAQLDPHVVLRRGYALVRTEKNTLVKKANDVKIGDLLTITAAHAILKAEVTHVESKQ
ncbi:MAG TPA: exodeoxyribonuclease VII large subunit [Candidatus Saccharimonadales bacterium]|nr:exodeoxyribonuclease VII large subunit [Candidatus Saccharimonadales bacterium]